MTNEPQSEFEKVLRDMYRAYGQPRSTTDQPAPADSEERKESASDMKSRDWAAVAALCVILGFVFAMAWLFVHAY